MFFAAKLFSEHVLQGTINEGLFNSLATSSGEEEFRESLLEILSDDEAFDKLMEETTVLSLLLAKGIEDTSRKLGPLPIEGLQRDTLAAVTSGAQRKEDALIRYTSAWREHFMALNAAEAYCDAIEKGLPLVVNLGLAHQTPVHRKLNRWAKKTFEENVSIARKVTFWGTSPFYTHSKRQVLKEELKKQDLSLWDLFKENKAH